MQPFSAVTYHTNDRHLYPCSVSSGSLQHLWDGWWSSAWPLLPWIVFSVGKLYCEFFHLCFYFLQAWFKIRFEQTHVLPLQGALVGLVAGLAMAFWIGIGSFLLRMSEANAMGALNTTNLPLFDNMTTAVMTPLVSATTAKPR